MNDFAYFIRVVYYVVPVAPGCECGLFNVGLAALINRTRWMDSKCEKLRWRLSRRRRVLCLQILSGSKAVVEFVELIAGSSTTSLKVDCSADVCTVIACV